ncbi:recombinase family protein [Faecalicoccus acidiformans]|uniref:Recombinase family protein n=1 Tax=Faecalicoccus acidiformans TaxID=915173 RepID=A0ABS2FMF0_9FIRM|nr:recombinase family protein [Faecalicoccus acidiformans]MBM6830957.1 recombinase family protein [Faecalicoccus acidiformans]
MERIVAIYLRVSTDEQARNGYGLGDQEEQCKKYLDLYYPDEQNVIIYKDDGYSGGNLKRPQMKKMIEDLKKEKIKMIIAFKLDRLTRSVVDTYKLISMVTEHDCSLIAVVDQLDINSANGRMLVGILSIIAQWEREVISERVICAYTEMARLGKYPFAGAPFGWKKDKELHLRRNLKEISIIFEMKNLFLEGYSYEFISRYIKKRYKLIIGTEQIRKILGREENIGIFHYRGTAYNNIFPAIMKKESYLKLKEQLKYRKPHLKQKKKYLFHGLIECKCGTRCNHFTTVKKNKTYYYYYCPKCSKRFNQDLLIDLTINEIILNRHLQNLSCKIDEREKKIKRLEHEKKETFEEYQNGQIDRGIYQFTIGELNKKQNRYKEEIDKLRICSKDEFLKIPYEEKYEFIHRYIAKIIVNTDTNQVLQIKYKKLIKELE